jgi:hypothetical protein
MHFRKLRIAPRQGHDLVRGQAPVSATGQPFDQFPVPPLLALEQFQAARYGFKLNLGMRKESVTFAQRQWDRQHPRYLAASATGPTLGESWMTL